ncbi:ulp1 protease family, C-terminal catalytic domain-containing protein [Tanacetum coccineum]
MSRTRTSCVPPTDKKISLEDLLKRANAEFPNDEKVIELYEKYRILFKKSVFAEDSKHLLDDFDNNDDDWRRVIMVENGKGVCGNICLCDLGLFSRWSSVVCLRLQREFVTRSSPKKRIVKPSFLPVHLSYMNKKSKAKLFCQFRCVYELSSVRLNMETLAPRLWIYANVIDCWLSILNHEELVRGSPSPRRHFFPTGCITQAMIEGTIHEKERWKVFSDEISAQFKHDVSSISLSEVDLKQAAMIILDNSDCGETYSLKYKAVCEPLKMFFARHLKNYNHPKHVFVDKLKHRIPKLKWSTTKNHSDCRVFTMIHLKSYVGKPVAQWDVGLCAKSDEQVSQLRRMRFKIATKILLRDLNVQAQKMFDLAFKFETENDKQTRISIIVNAIKNRAERDPAKTKTVDENQEEDALKNKRHG